MIRLCVMDEDQWMHEGIMPKEVDMDENEEECGVNEPHVDCSDAFNTSQVFDNRDDVLRLARSVTYENGFVTEWSGEYRCRKKEFVRRDTETRKCGCLFKLCGKPMVGGQGWMVKLICGIHNHELAKSLFGHPYVRRLTKAEKTLIVDMTKSMDEDVVRDIFWCHLDVVKLVNACNLVFLIGNTYKINRYRLSLLDFVGVTPTGMTFSAGFAYLEGERLNNVVWALERFRGIFLRRDVLLGVIVTDRDLALMNAVKIIFPECKNLLCSFHINKNVKAKCKSLIGQRNAWEYVMDAWGTLVDCPSEQHFDECLKRFEMVCSPWPMFVDYVKDTWIIPHKEKFVTAWTNKIAAEFKHVHYAGKNPSTCGCVVRTMHGLPCACELSKYVVGCIPLDSIHMFWRRLSFSDQGLSKPEVSIKEVMETISKRFEELDVCGKFTLKTKLCEIAYPNQNSMCPPPAKVNTKGAPKKPKKKNPRSTKRDPSYWKYVDVFHSQQNSNSSVRRSSSSSDQLNPRRMMPMLDLIQPFIHDFIDNIIDVEADGNCGCQSVAGLLGMGEDYWSLVHTHLLIELGKFSKDYIKLFGGTDRFEDLRMSLHVDGLTKVTMDKWMDKTDMGYVIASRYNIYLKDRCPLPPIALLWSSNCHPKVNGVVDNTDRNHVHMEWEESKEFSDCVVLNSLTREKGDTKEFRRTPVGILNILEATMTPTHDALLYYNGGWNMPRQNEFVGYSFTRKNPKKFDIPSGCIMDELEDLIKQVAPHGFPLMVTWGISMDSVIAG
ncbi:Protein FAR1-RELATED SEQUENCE 5 [Glycine soja]